MTFMTWSDHYLTGIAIVDQQHQKLVEMINNAAPILAANQTSGIRQTGPLLDALLDYVKTHFSTEDYLMQVGGIDPRHLSHHRQSHGEFAAQVQDLRRQFEQGNDVNGNDLLRFLSNWLAFHILGEDQRMARELKAIEQGFEADETYDQVEGNQARILQGANDVLVNALVNLFVQMTEQNRALVEKNQKIQATHDELDIYRRNLEQLVNIRTAELRHAKEAAEAASNAKSRFMATVSHELLTPLNAILGFGHLLEHADIPGKQQQQARRIVQAAEQLSGLLNEILQFSRLEAGEISIDKAPFTAGALLAQLEETLHKAAHIKGLTLTIDLDPDMPPLLGDAGMLRHALETLAGNAIKFTEHGGVTLAAHVLDRQDERLRIAFDVRDTGIGIAPERQKALFRAFEQLDSSTTRRHPGIGLGLVICAQLVKLMGGELTLDSSPETGTQCRISLWLDNGERHEREEATESQASTESLDELKALLAQDNIAARQRFAVLRGYLQRIDAELTTLLAKQINHYQFEDALATLGRIIERS